MKFNSIEQVYDAVRSGCVVHWGNTSYIVVLETPNVLGACPWAEFQGKVLTVRCKSNWFGSVLELSEVSNCFIKQKEAM